jgi:hypothetical protein
MRDGDGGDGERRSVSRREQRRHQAADPEASDRRGASGDDGGDQESSEKKHDVEPSYVRCCRRLKSDAEELIPNHAASQPADLMVRAAL